MGGVGCLNSACNWDSVFMGGRRVDGLATQGDGQIGDGSFTHGPQGGAQGRGTLQVELGAGDRHIVLIAVGVMVQGPQDGAVRGSGLERGHDIELDATFPAIGSRGDGHFLEGQDLGFQTQLGFIAGDQCHAAEGQDPFPEFVFQKGHQFLVLDGGLNPDDSQ